MSSIKTLTRTSVPESEGPPLAAATKWEGMMALGDFMGPTGDLVGLVNGAVGGIISTTGAFTSAAYQMKVDLLSF